MTDSGGAVLKSGAAESPLALTCAIGSRLETRDSVWYGFWKSQSGAAFFDISLQFDGPKLSRRNGKERKTERGRAKEREREAAREKCKAATHLQHFDFSSKVTFRGPDNVC